MQFKLNKYKNARKTILFSLYSLVISSIFLLWNSIFPKKSIQIKSMKYPLYNASIDMNVLVVNEFNLSRIFSSYQIWGKDFVQMFPNSNFNIISRRNISSLTKYAKTVFFQENLEDDQNLIFGFSETLSNFCTNTTKLWYIRTTEDTFIDIRHLQSFIDILEQKYSPFNDFIIQGQTCKIDEDYTFIHGGSGWIMSRKAACDVNDNMNSFLNEFFQIKSGDDIITHIIQKYYNLKNEDIKNEAFLGTKLNNKSVQMLINRDYKNISKCMEYFDSTYKNPLNKPIQLNKIVFWHSGRSDNFPIYDAYDILSTIPDNINVVFLDHESEICWK